MILESAIRPLGLRLPRYETPLTPSRYETELQEREGFLAEQPN
jgi:hypothetical protein